MSGLQGFEALSGRLDYPMAVVTLQVDGKRAGCLVGFASQCSIDPVRYLVCLSHKNHTYRVAQQGVQRLAVHLLEPDQTDLAALFGAETGDDTDKFARCRWHAGPDGVPVLDDAPAWFSGPVAAAHDLGDHTGYVIDVDESDDTGRSDRFLGFQQVKYLDPGHDA